MVIARLRNGVGGEGELERNGVFYVPASYCIHVFASLTPPTAPAHRPLPSWACVMHVSIAYARYRFGALRRLHRIAKHPAARCGVTPAVANAGCPTRDVLSAVPRTASGRTARPSLRVLFGVALCKSCHRCIMRL